MSSETSSVTLPKEITPVWLKSLNTISNNNNLSAIGSVLLTEEEILEKESMQRERHWLLINEVPFICKELKSKIEQALHTINTSNYQMLNQNRKKKGDDKEQPTSPPSSPPPQPFPEQYFSDSQASFESADSTLRGSIKFESWHVSEAEIIVKSNRWNKNIPFKTNITGIHPLKLYQLHNSYNFLKTALEIIQKLERLVAATRDTGHVDDIRVNKIMEDVSANLRLAMEELLFGNPAFPDSTLFSSTVYQPALPQDLLVECNISNKEVVVTAYCLHVITHKPPKISKHSQPPKLGDIVQSSRNGQQYWVEVVDFAQVRLPSERISAAFALTNSASQICAEFRDKITIFL